MELVYKFFEYFSLFLIYSFIGWLFEVFLALVKEHKFINRGFLIGPILPIWGSGAMLITLILKPSDSIFNLIVSSAFIGTSLEYVVNYLMEKLFKARWWDYSHLPFNINGRVWLGASATFGVGGLFVIEFLNPCFLNLLGTIDKSLLIYIGSVLLLIMIIDLCVSCKIIKNLKLSVNHLKKDYTEEISKKVKSVLSEKSREFSRLLKAFPNVNFSLKQKK